MESFFLRNGCTNEAANKWIYCGSPTLTTGTFMRNKLTVWYQVERRSSCFNVQYAQQPKGRAPPAKYPE